MPAEAALRRRALTRTSLRRRCVFPHSAFLDQGYLDKVCQQANLKAGTCLARSIYGRAKAWSPLLDKPLEGPVCLGVGFGYKSLPYCRSEWPDPVLLKGKNRQTKQEGIRNTFEAVPDAAVSRFVLEMKAAGSTACSKTPFICWKEQVAAPASMARVDARDSLAALDRQRLREEQGAQAAAPKGKIDLGLGAAEP